MSSHREAPEISKDPVADSTDVYAFVSPDKPSTVTLIANYVPLQEPAGGPNFYEFGADILSEIHIDTSGNAESDISYQFLFTTEVTNQSTFLYNTAPITSLTSSAWNRKQFYSVTLRRLVVTTTGLPLPPGGKVYELWLIGPRRTAPAGLLPAATAGRTEPVLATGLVPGDNLAMTVEPAGGTAAPTTTPIVVVPLLS